MNQTVPAKVNFVEFTGKVNWLFASAVVTLSAGLFYIGLESATVEIFLNKAVIFTVMIGFLSLIIWAFLSMMEESKKEIQTLKMSLKLVLGGFPQFDTLTKVKVIKPLLQKLILIDSLEQEYILRSMDNIPVVGFIMDMATSERDIVHSEISAAEEAQKVNQKLVNDLRNSYENYTEIRHMCADIIEDLGPVPNS